MNFFPSNNLSDRISQLKDQTMKRRNADILRYMTHIADLSPTHDQLMS